MWPWEKDKLYYLIMISIKESKYIKTSDDGKVGINTT